MALAAFTPTGQVAMAATNTSQVVTIPADGTPTQVIVTNFGPADAFVALAATVTVATGTPVLARQSIALTLGDATELAAMTVGGTATLRITAAT